MTDYGTFEEEELRLAATLMDLVEFERRHPVAAAGLVRLAGGRERVVSVLPDEEPHCEWSALCEEQAESRGVHQLPGRRDRVAVYVRTTHPLFEDRYPDGHPDLGHATAEWVWEDEL